MNRNHWLAALVILGLLIAGCMSTPGPSKDNNSPELTKKANVYESLSMFDGYLERSPHDWYINGSFCEGGSCRQQLLANNGDIIVVTLTQYPSISDAKNSFNSMKKGLAQYSVSDEKIADSGYVWHKGNQGESGFLSGQNIGVVDYLLAKGDATGNESTNLAIVLSQIVVSSL
ncbi:MAG: hypothetical protein NTV68_02640 [Methanomicrobiales archaeon]|nr:hypothetical protein [Methanomicrobiales archaeon]